MYEIQSTQMKRAAMLTIQLSTGELDKTFAVWYFHQILKYIRKAGKNAR